MAPHASEPDPSGTGQGPEVPGSPSGRPGDAAPEGPSRAKAGDQPPSSDQATLDELRRRVAELEGGKQRRHRVRSVLSAVLVILAALLSILSVVAVWVNSIVGDTDRYVATVAPLADDPAVQTAVTNRATAAILAQIDVKALVAQLSDAAAQKGVPPKAAELINNLDGPIESGLKELISSTVRKVVSSSAFETLWVDANRVAHTALDKALTGKGGGAVSLKNNQVSIDLGPIVAKAKDELVKAGFAPAAAIPEVHTTFVVYSSDDLGKIKTYMRILQILGTWLPVVTVIIAAAAVFLSAHRRRILIATVLSIAFAMLLLGTTLAVFKNIYLDRLPPSVYQPAASAVFDDLVRFLRSSVRAVAAVALVTAIGAFLIGPSRAAVTVRRAGADGIGSVRGATESAGLRLGPVGRFVHRYKRWIGGVILLGAVLVLVTWSYPTTQVVLWIGLVVLAAFAIREFLDDAGPQDGAERTGPDAPPRPS
ncbi:hypothetical protein OG729_16075 [Streptomyces sp. NBC_00210]|uniref:hypothetical protein n=1 Tax=unclassified Streptomyces TaxID=2593676 RepID=UPI003255D8F0